MKETKRQVNTRINKLIKSLKDKNKFYCSSCMLEFDKIIEIENCTNHNHIYSINWCKECNEFSTHFYKSQICCKCKSKESGLGNPEIHSKTIKTQIKNGTFNMLNPEIQKKKVSNKNLEFKMENLHCSICKIKTAHRVYKTGIKSCMSCLSRDFGFGNSETHQKTINNQIKNGTFNMMNPEVHSKATKNRIKNYLSGDFYCFKCGEKEILNAFGLCKKCNKEIAKETIKSKYCKICDKETPHNGKYCLICNPESGGCIIPNFITKNNVRYYKDELVEDIIYKLNSGEYNVSDFPGWNKRFGEWYYFSENILTGEITKLNNSNFYIKNEIEYFYNFSIGDYIPWKEFSDKLYQNIQNNNYNSDLENILIQEEDFVKEPIIKINEEQWNRIATDKYLCDKGYGWIVYIKMFKSCPFIVGKTGTSIVHQSEIDFDFIVGDENDYKRSSGKGCKFIRENYPEVLYTDFDYVLVKNFETEQEALNFEGYIIEKYDLFES